VLLRAEIVMVFVAPLCYIVGMHAAMAINTGLRSHGTQQTKNLKYIFCNQRTGSSA